MEFNLKQWREQQEESEEEQPSAKIPRQQLLLQSPHQHQHQHQHQQQPVSAALPLFVSAHSLSQPSKISSHLSLSPYPLHSSFSFPRVGEGNGFSKRQWEELEVQAVIFRHMLAGAAVPADLLHLVKKSLLNNNTCSPFYLHHYPYPHPSPLWYWGKGAMDPEPGRCRRTDGKKWRCSRDAVVGHKYCDRHIHRGRNRSRKPVESPPPGAAAQSLLGFDGGGGGAQFTLTGPEASSLDAFQLHQSQRSEKNAMFESQRDTGDGKSNNSKVLMRFFDDWPRSLQEPPPPNNNPETNQHSPSGMSLSMSTNGNPTSDFLRLSTGNMDELGQRNEERQRGESGWANRWGENPVGSMGGPLAEALRSSTNLSPTSVLHQPPRCSTSDTSYVGA